MAKIGVIIGRFQPFHQGHAYLVQCALDANMDKILFLCGSSNRARSFKNHKAYTRLAQEQQFLLDYKKSWSTSPYPPIFVTADALVCCQEHILLIKRGNHPGQGLYALPGGFIEATELVQTAVVRELQEETTIALDSKELLAALEGIKVYDYPSRSQIGRVITHVGRFQLQNPDPVAVKANDDAQEALWYPCEQIAKIAHKMHDDHFLIIQDQLSWYKN